MRFSYSASHPEHWLALLKQLRKTGDGATTTGLEGKGDSRGSEDEVGKGQRSRLHWFWNLSNDRSSYSLYWPGPTWVLSFPISVWEGNSQIIHHNPPAVWRWKYLTLTFPVQPISVPSLLLLLMDPLPSHRYPCVHTWSFWKEFIEWKEEGGCFKKEH